MDSNTTIVWRDPAGKWRSNLPLPEPFLVVKKPVPIRAREMPVPFVTDTLEGEKLQGKPGDFLMEGVAGEFYPCNREIFFASYDRLTFWTRLCFAFKVLFAR
jgi:hypothetical protein